MKFRNIILTLGIGFILSIQAVNAQTSFSPGSSIKVQIGLPNNTSNKAFRSIMQGLVILTPSYQYTFENSFAIGAGLRYGYFNVNEFKNNASLTGGMHSMGAFLKIGQEKYFGRFGLDYGIRMGYTMNYFLTNLNKANKGGPYSNNSILIEPTISFALMATENSSFNFFMGYAIQNFKFRPNQVGLDYFSGISEEDNNKITSYFSIGFGYSYFFNRK